MVPDAIVAAVSSAKEIMLSIEAAIEAAERPAKIFEAFMINSSIFKFIVIIHSGLSP